MRKAAIFLTLVASLPPAAGQVATQADIEVIDRRLIDLDARLRALEQEKLQRLQAEHETELRRQQAAQTQQIANCTAYRRRIAGGKMAADSPGQAMIDQMDKFDCDHLEKGRLK